MSSPPSPSFPPQDHPILAEFADGAGPPGKPGRAKRILAAMAVIAGLTMLAVWLIPQEAQKWRLASAEEKRLSGDLDGAIAQLDEDIARSPRNIELRRTRVAWLLEKKDYESALREIDQIITWQPADVAVYQLRAQTHWSLGKFDKAVEDWKKIMSFDSAASGPGRPEFLNGLAYARALANVELDEGLANVNEAMRIKAENFEMLDTRGFLYYRKGDLDRALKDLDNAVQFAEAKYQESLSGSFFLPDHREKQLYEKLRAQSLAVIHYHRGLIHEARGEEAKAENDFARVRELGFEPTEALF